MIIKIECSRVDYPKGKPYRRTELGHTYLSNLKRKSLGLYWDDLGHYARRVFPQATWFRASEWTPNGVKWIISGTV